MAKSLDDPLSVVARDELADDLAAPALDCRTDAGRDIALSVSASKVS